MIEIVFFDAGETILHPHPSFPELFASVCVARGRRVSPEDVVRVQESLAPHLVDLAEDSGVTNPSLSAADARTFWTYLYRRFLEELGISDATLPAALFETFSDASSYMLFDDVMPSLSAADARTFWTYLYRRFLADLGISDEALAMALFETFSDASSYMLFDDVMPSLRTLQDEGYRLGLISNFEGWLEERLIELEVGHVFDVSVISGLEGVEKPDPEIYRRALERAQVTPEAAMHVGDSPTYDIAPAATLGMHTVLLDRVGRYPQASGARITSLKELPPLVANF